MERTNERINYRGTREMNTVYDIVMEHYIDQQNKHELGEGWAEKQIEEMDKIEFLLSISHAVNTLLLRKAQEK